MTATVRANAAIVRAHSPAGLLSGVCEAIAGGPFCAACIVVPDREAPYRATIVARARPAAGYFDGLEFRWHADDPYGRGPFGESVRSGGPAALTVSDPRFAPWRERARQFGINAVLTVPIPDEARFAVLAVYCSEPEEFSPGEIAVFASLGRDLELALRGLRTRELLVLRGRAKTSAPPTSKRRCAARSRPCRGRSKCAIRRPRPRAPGCGLEQTARGGTVTRCGAGAWAVPRGPRARHRQDRDPGRDPQQAAAVVGARVRDRQAASRRGLRDRQSDPVSSAVADIVRQHHECLDGSGYPRGLVGNEICSEARILSVADIVDAMSSRRPYRAAASLETACKEIEALAGTKLDAEVVAACVRVVARGDFVAA